MSQEDRKKGNTPAATGAGPEVRRHGPRPEEDLGFMPEGTGLYGTPDDVGGMDSGAPQSAAETNASEGWGGGDSLGGSPPPDGVSVETARQAAARPDLPPDEGKPGGKR